jgi:RNA polymerase sigma factor (sigma-70 family)
MVEEKYLEDYNSLVGYVAYEYAKRYRMVDVQDIRQELWLWFLSRPNKLKDWYENFEQRDRDKLIARSLRNAAQKYCTKEKAKSVGYETSDVYYYDAAVIEEFMPYILTDSYSMPVGVNDLNYKPNTNSIAENNTWLAVRTDISIAFESVNERHQNVLRLRFGSLNTTLKDVAQELSISADAARKRVDRAMAALIEELGGKRPYPDNDYGNHS